MAEARRADSGIPKPPDDAEEWDGVPDKLQYLER